MRQGGYGERAPLQTFSDRLASGGGTWLCGGMGMPPFFVSKFIVELALSREKARMPRSEERGGMAV